MNHDTIFQYTAVLELPFLIATVIFAFLVAGKLKGGEFGKGMLLIAYGALIMAIGHIHMQWEMFTGVNLFQSLLGNTIGSIAWGVALLATWTLTTYGFYTVYQASKV